MTALLEFSLLFHPLGPSSGHLEPGFWIYVSLSLCARDSVFDDLGTWILDADHGRLVICACDAVCALCVPGPAGKSRVSRVWTSLLRTCYNATADTRRGEVRSHGPTRHVHARCAMRRVSTP